MFPEFFYDMPTEEELVVADRFTQLYLESLKGEPKSFFIFEQAISDDQVLLTLGFDGSRKFIHELNAIHLPAGCDNPSLHVGT